MGLRALGFEQAFSEGVEGGSAGLRRVLCVPAGYRSGCGCGFGRQCAGSFFGTAGRANPCRLLLQ